MNWRSALLFLAIFFLFLHPVGGDGDFWHHLNTGKFVVTTLSLPKTDIWTFAAHDRPWVAYAWASGVIFYLLFHTFGPIGISVLVALVGTGTCFFLWKRYGSAIILAAPLFSLRFPDRPEIFLYFFTALFLFLQNKTRWHWLFPILILFWANLYGASVLLGIALLLFWKQWKWAAISLPLSFINGYGVQSVFYGFLYIPTVARTQGEWFGLIPTITQAPESYLFFFSIRLALYTIWSILVIKNNRLFAPIVLVPILVIRTMTLATILTVPAIKKFPLWIALLFWVVAVWLSPPGVGLDTAMYPKEFQHLTGRIINPSQIGGFLTYYNYPNLLIYTDTRDDLFIGRNIPTINAVTILPVAREFHANLILLTRDQMNIIELLKNSSDWKLQIVTGEYWLFSQKTSFQ